MRFSSIKYFMSDAFKSIWRNRTISLASVATVAATLFIFGVFLLVGLNINEAVADVEDKIEVRVYLDLEATEEQVDSIETQLNSETGVAEIEFETKEQALENFRKELKGKEDLLDGYDEENNPMQASFIVKLAEPKYAQDIEKKYNNVEGVDEVGNDQEIIDKIAGLAKTVRWVGIAIFIILIAVSLFLIGNTIKITVFSRRREVGIMKFVGATDWFIRWPFVIEGIVIGIIGALVSTVILYFAYRYLYTSITTGMFITTLVEPVYVLSTITWEFLLAGIFIGAVGSILSLRKFLVV
ncbi:permease-like cell division protein FtsX [Alloiococcus sp. CFN-8]|uniref:permease-like cell division protein FtsX n=1 Tax=Alloiococcus sp. CFN-8 TaxID=3416081 RepID=UPI003CFAD44F